jgi:hypothetical protein
MEHADVPIVMNEGMVANHIHFSFTQFDKTRVKPAVIRHE